jgi:hypothetical protein
MRLITPITNDGARGVIPLLSWCYTVLVDYTEHSIILTPPDIPEIHDALCIRRLMLVKKEGSQLKMRNVTFSFKYPLDNHSFFLTRFNHSTGASG